MVMFISLHNNYVFLIKIMHMNVDFNVDCGRKSILNGEVIFPSGTKYNAVSQVACHDGYRINGSDTLTCLSSGIWTPDSECIPKGQRYFFHTR